MNLLVKSKNNKKKREVRSLQELLDLVYQQYSNVQTSKKKEVL